MLPSYIYKYIYTYIYIYIYTYIYIYLQGFGVFVCSFSLSRMRLFLVRIFQCFGSERKRVLRYWEVELVSNGWSGKQFDRVVVVRWLRRRWTDHLYNKQKWSVCLNQTCLKEKVLSNRNCVITPGWWLMRVGYRTLYSHVVWWKKYACIYIYIYIYIMNNICFYIYSIAWILICDHWFHAVFPTALSQLLSTLQIIPHFVCHKPTKWDSDNHTLL